MATGREQARVLECQQRARRPCQEMLNLDSSPKGTFLLALYETRDKV
jgi:hypothetical protein